MSSAFDQIREVAGYRLAERIGAGGMGEVYKAYNSSLNRFAAVKILFQETLADRFKNEAYIQASISHPNIARLYEFTKSGDKHCIVMEYVEGESLDSLLRRKRKLSNEETENILRQIVSALSYLHKKDIFHRDIKPQNFRIQPDGTVKMLDFGIAKHKYTPKFTQLGFIVGTTEYLAPEQFQQESGLKSDIWALAVMTYELVTGFMPFEGDNPAMIQTKIRKGIYTNPKILIPGLSERLSVIIEKGMKVAPAQRIGAAGIEAILGNKEGPEASGYNLQNLPAKKILIPGIAGFTVLVILFLMMTGNEGEGNRQTDEVKPGNYSLEEKENKPPFKQNAESNLLPAARKENKIIINAPGISNAELILNDGSRQPLPYTVSGREGEQFEFTIHADGYRDKDVQVVLTPRRISYEFNLEKNNK